MSKPKTQPVPSETDQRSNKPSHNDSRQEPLSGSKKTKQANHSRHNNGEG